MQTLKQKIEEAEQEIRGRQEAIKQWGLKLLSLKLERSDCPHSFTASVPGYEHEGGLCTMCGINEVHAASQRIGAQYK